MKIPNAKLAQLITALAIDRAQRAARNTIAAARERKSVMRTERVKRANTSKRVDTPD